MGDEPYRSYASPPCLAHEIDPAYFDPLAVDPQQARDVARWRRAERTRLREARAAIPVAERAGIAARIAGHLSTLIAEVAPAMEGVVTSGYWPIKGEPDLRDWLAGVAARGGIACLPSVEEVRAPLTFRRWRAGMPMVRGHWNIPVPPPEAEAVHPAITLAPVVGWDGEGYRLGYGGGYFDRTLAALSPRPFAIGVGLEAARIATIYPQPHDIPLDAIVTEAGVKVRRTRAAG